MLGDLTDSDDEDAVEAADEAIAMAGWVARLSRAKATERLNVVQNWFGELRCLVPVGPRMEP